ncbi:CfaE/CblD family pilus tip adhesin [Burkholderia ambifaria]|uniref:CfaE/CblD family pilus tip adhesin n=1 Tax=Burkholderia ambifaria TaxID=152480 RepID=UPI0024461BB1|nr:CfaE/CblD family pilus tip adhesin [Burkholderia ambifaria]
MQAPADRNDVVQATADRGISRDDIAIFDRASGGFDTDSPEKWGRNFWSCLSSYDPAIGACRTMPAEVGAGSTEIQLLFKEQETGATAVLKLLGQMRMGIHVDCNGNVMSGKTSTSILPIHSNLRFHNTGCKNSVVYFDERLLSVNIPAAEIAKLPSGGIWTANLTFRLRRGDVSAYPLLAWFRASVTLNVTDKNNIQIYLPEFGNATPTVDLRLRKLPNGSRMSGTSTVDMCLYDGYNSQSTWFDVSVSDGLTIDRREKGQYSVLLDADKSGAYESRIDYNASLTFAGKRITLPNNETVRIQGVNNSAGRSVSLPGIPVPVICTPTPLTLETPEFQSAWKRPGKYSNKLTITFTPSSASL